MLRNMACHQAGVVELKVESMPCSARRLDPSIPDRGPRLGSRFLDVIASPCKAVKLHTPCRVLPASSPRA